MHDQNLYNALNLIMLKSNEIIMACKSKLYMVDCFVTIIFILGELLLIKQLYYRF